MNHPIAIVTVTADQLQSLIEDAVARGRREGAPVGVTPLLSTTAFSGYATSMA